MARSYTVSFNITGAMDGSLLAALQHASKAMRGLGQSARAASSAAKSSQAGFQELAKSLSSLQLASQKFRELKKAVIESQKLLSAAQNNANQLAAKYQRDAQAAEQLRQKLAQLNTELSNARTPKEISSIQNTAQKFRDLKKAIADNQAALSTAQGNVNQLAAGYQRDAQAAEQLRQKLAQLNTELSNARTPKEISSIQNTAQKFRDLKKAIADNQAALSAAQGNVNQLAAGYQRDAQAAEQLRQKLAQLNTELSNARSTKATAQANLKDLQKQMRGLKKEFGSAKLAGDSLRMLDLSAKMSSLGSSIQDQQAKLKAAAQTFKELSAQIKQTQAELKAAESAAKQSGKGFNNAKTQAGNLKSKLQGQLAALQKLRSQLGAAGFSTKNFADSMKGLEQGIAKFKELSAQIKQTQAELKAAESAAKQSGKGFNNAKTQAGNLKSKLQGQLAALQKLRSQLGAAGFSTKNFADSMKGLEQGIAKFKELSAQIKQTQAELKAAESAAKQSGKGFDSAKTQAANLKAKYQEQLAALQQLRTQLGAAGFSTSHFAESERRLQQEIDRVNNSLRQQQQLLQARQASDAAAFNLNNAYSDFQNALQTADTITSPFKAAVDNAMTLEKRLSRLKALTQLPNIRAGNFAQVEKEVSSMEKTIKTLGLTTEFTSNEVADAANYFAMSGWKPNKINEVLPSTTDMATIMQMPIGRVADYFSDDLAIMGVKVGEQIKLADGKMVDAVSHFSDAMAYAVTNANLNYDQLHTSLTYNAPSMKLAGLSLGEILASNMVSANAGLKGSVSGTALRTGFIRLQAPAKAGAKALEETGVSASEAQKEMAAAGAAMEKFGIKNDDMMTKLIKIKQHFDENAKNGISNAPMINDIFGKHGYSTWANLFSGTNLSQLQEIAKAINSSAIEGWTKDTAAIMRDNTRTSIDLLTSALDALQEKVGTALTPAVRTAAEAFTPLVQSAAEFIAAHPGIVQAAAGIATALAGIVVAAAAVKLAFAGWGFITSSFALVKMALAGLGVTSAATAFTALRTAILGAARAALAFVFTPVGAALAVLAAMAYAVYTNWDRVAPSLNRIGDALSGSLKPALDAANQALDNLGNSPAFQSLGTLIGNLINLVGNGLCGAFIILAGTVGTVLAGIAVGIADLVKTIADLGTGLSEAFDKIADGEYAAGFEKIGQAAKGVWENCKKGSRDFYQTFKKGFIATDDALEMFMSPLHKLPKSNVTARHTVRPTELEQAPAPVQVPSADSATIQAMENILGKSAQQEVIQSALAQIPAPAQEIPPLDLSQAQSGLDAVGTSAQQASSQMDGIQTAGTNLQTVATNAQTAGTNLQSVATNAQTAGTNLQSVATNAQTAGTNLETAATGAQNLGTSAGNATGQVDALGTSAGGATGGVDALGSAAGNSVGNISAMSAAASAVASSLSAKAAEISSIHISIPTVSVGGSVAANAEGGIYKKGAFLTTFAEKTPEAAIPLNKTKRSKDLWASAGQMLGILPGKSMFPKQNPPNSNTTKNPRHRPRITSPEFDFDRAYENLFGRKNPLTELMTPPTFPASEQSESTTGRAKSPRQRRRRGLNFPVLTTPPTFPSKKPKPRFPDLPTPTFPRLEPPNSNTTKNPRHRPRITSPEFDFDRAYENLFGRKNPLTEIMHPQDSSGEMSGLMNRQGMFQPSAQPATINLTVNVTVNGKADEATVKRGVEAALPAVDDWAQKFSAHQREQRRRSFA